MDKPLKDFSALNQKKEQIRKCITKIMNTLSFRKLAGKTQVILSLTGPDVRTRLTHTIEVARIAKDICFELGLNEDLAEAMALAHDIGHTPFGHVGERTLRDIMCGCDTLGDKVQDCDFDNSGFKHNLQSFRVLIDLERINNDSNGKVEYKNIWPYIIWGALAHTKMTYAKSYSGMDDEIFVSSKHCDWVYVCYHHNKKECKRNIQKKKEKEKKVEKKEICKPWYCAKLPVLKDREKIDEKLLNIDETTIEYIKKEPIERQYVDKKIYCSHKCYMAKLWEHKIYQKPIYLEYPYLFDHPFPNSFYAKSLNSYFSKTVDGNIPGFVSFEAQIVKQADEIAQRQQDLEDGINQGLLPFEIAKKDVETLIKAFNSQGIFQDIINELNEPNKINNSNKLGKLLSDFYKKAIIDQTEHNVTDFVTNTEKVQINIYSLMNILYSIDDDNGNKEKWILEEFKALDESSGTKDRDEIKCLEHYFEIDFEPVYLYLLSYDHLESCTKRNEYPELTIDIMSKCIDSLNVPTEDLSESGAKDFLIFKNNIEVLKNNRLEFDYGFIRTLDLLRNYFFKHHREESDDFFKNQKKKWKTVGWLKLRSFYSLYHIFKEKHKNNNGPIVTISDLANFKAPIDYKREVHAVTAFNNWKKVLKHDANKVLGNLVTFTDADKNNDDDNRGKALADFEENQRNTILKSEPVEKNDGKASYILRRLFKAYITNSHQLPDLGLKYIIISLIRDGELDALVKSEKEACKEILDKLEKTMITITGTKDELRKIWNIELLDFETDDEEFKKHEKGKSNEIKAALVKRKQLAAYFQELDKNRDRIIKIINSEEEKDKNFIKEQLRNLRANLDNAILNKTRYWESIMTRGICDYIAALTDQEAVNEYEKLYAGIMELV